MSDRIPFSKMHGLGNDFVVINLTDPRVNRQALTPQWFRAIADRHWGVGCDQILLLDRAQNPLHDFDYRIVNSDGSPAGQCGNGARCLGLFIHRQALSSKTLLHIGMPEGAISLECQHLLDNEGIYRVNMSAPIFAEARVPYCGPALDPKGNTSLNFALDPNDKSKTVSCTANVLSMGNPHAVLIVEDVAKAPVKEWGAIIETHRYFPQRVNVGFMQIINRQSLRLRVFERGAGETLACGSGACAAVVAGIRQGVVANDQPVQVTLQGGQLHISWDGQASSAVWMEGKAVAVFDSDFPIDPARP